MMHILELLIFSVFIFPFTLILAIITGIIDGLTRFKTLATPILRVKIIFSLIILSLSVALLFVAPVGNLYILTIVLSIFIFVVFEISLLPIRSFVRSTDCVIVPPSNCLK